MNLLAVVLIGTENKKKPKFEKIEIQWKPVCVIRDDNTMKAA
jgi:hypothetical protein